MKYETLIKRIKNKDIKLSFSSLKQFAKTPEHFVRYKLEKFLPTPAMIFGNLVDTLIFTEEKLHDNFIIGATIPTAENQKLFCQYIFDNMQDEITDDLIKSAFSEAYKKGDPEDVYLKLKTYIEGVLANKDVVTQAELDHAKKIKEALYKNKAGANLMNQITTTQHKLEWEYLGWKFIGYADGTGENVLMDLKVTDADPKKIERFIFQKKTYVQLAMYYMALGKKIERFKILAIDKGLNVSVTELSEDYITYGIKEFKGWVRDFNKCIMLNRFTYNYDFFGKHNGEYHINKPLYADELMQVYDE